MFKIIDESKTQNQPDDYIKFTFKTKLYIANTLRRGLCVYPWIWAFDNFKIETNTTNIEDATLILRLQSLPIIQSKIKSSSDRFIIDVSDFNDDKSIDIMSNDIKQFSPGSVTHPSPLDCLIGICYRGQMLKMSFGVKKGNGIMSSIYCASALPIMTNDIDSIAPNKKKTNEEDNIVDSFDNNTFTFKLISVGALEPRTHCIETIKQIMKEILDIKQDFEFLFNGKQCDRMTMKTTSKDSRLIIIQKYDDLIPRLICDAIYDEYPQIENIGIKEDHPFVKTMIMNIHEKSKNPEKIIIECVDIIYSTFKKMLSDFTKI